MPASRTPWAPNGVPGFYIGPALQHYRYLQAWATPAHSVRITDTLAWFPTDFRMPEISPLDHATAAILDLATTLNSLTPLRSTHSSSPQPHSPVDSIVSSRQEILQQYSPPSSTTLLPIQRVISPVFEPVATPIPVPHLSSPPPISSPKLIILFFPPIFMLLNHLPFLSRTFLSSLVLILQILLLLISTPAASY